MKKILSVILILAMSISLLAGCNGNPANSGETGAKEIRIGRAYDATTLDPHNGNDDGSYNIIKYLSEGLVRDKNGVIVPGVAESWEINEAGTEVVFKLRKDAKWSDGTALTAEDFRYSFMRLLDPNVGYNYSDSAFIFKNAEKYFNGECTADEVGIEVIDEYTLKIVRENPSIETLNELAATAFLPIRRDVAEQHGVAYGSEADKIMTNGAFTLTEWSHEAKMVLVKNENYWDKDSINLDKMIMVMGVSGETAVDMMLAGELDLIQTGDQLHVDTLTAEGFGATPFASGYQCIHMNSAGRNEETAKFMNNANFRRALNLTINRDAIIAAALKGCQATTRISAPTDMGVKDTMHKEYPYQGWPTGGDAAEAKKYFDLAMQELGTTAADVPELSMLCFDSAGTLTILQAAQDMLLNNLGIKCVIDPQPIQQMIGKAISGDWDFWYGGMTRGTMDWLSSGSVADGFDSDPAKDEYGTYNYCNEAFNALYRKAIATMDIKERKDLLFEMEKILVSDPATILLGWNRTYVVTKDGLTGLLISGSDSDYTYMDLAQ
jgi:oligopeptide transport system substrate-binding protein